MNAWNTAAEKIVDWLATTSWQAAVLALLVVAVQLLFRRILSARWSYLLWLLVVGRLLLPSLPESPISLYRYVPASPVSQIHFATTLPPSAAQPLVQAVPGSAPASSDNVPSSPAVSEMSAQGVLLIVWFAGFLTLAISLFERNLRFRRTVLAGYRPASDQVRELAGSLAREMGVTRRFEVVEAKSLETPAVVGLLRTKLLLPHDFAARLSENELALIFRHELAHLKRGDLRVNFLVCVLQIVHWFNPVLWWAFGRMRHDRELATDALALHSRSVSRLAYGETLVKLAAGNLPRTSLNPAIGILENHRRIRQRIEQISRLGPKAYAWSVAGLVLLVALGLVTLTKAPARDHQSPAVADTTKTQRSAFQADFDRPIREGNTDLVRFYLDHGADPNGSVGAVLRFGPSGPVDYGPVLFYAVANQHENIVKLLLSRGAHPEAKSGWGETPAHRALATGNKAIANDLIAAGAKYDPVQYLTATGDVAGLAKKDAAQPFTIGQLNNIVGNAASAGQIPVIEWAWPKLKLSPAQAMEKRSYLLKAAAEWKQLNVAQYLIGQGVDFPKVGRDAFETAIQENSPEVARLIAEKFPAAFDAKRNLYPFRENAGLGRLGIVQLLLELGCDINGHDDQGLTPLCGAAYLQQEAVCKFLIEYGADISLRDNRGENAAWYAAFGAGCPETLKMLLDRHIDLGGRNSNGWPIMVNMLTFSDPRPGVNAFPGKIYTPAEIEEAHRKQREVIGLLAHAGADLNAKSSIGSPLTLAIQDGKDTIVRALIENGADVKAEDGRGYTPLAAAANAYDPDLSLPTIQLLLDKGADPNTTSVYAYNKPPLPPQSILKSLLLREAALNHPDPAFPAVMKLLLSRGAHFTAPIADRDNRWLVAAATGDLDALKAMKSQGVSLDTSDGDRWTALDVALAAGQAPCADWLLQAGAKASFSTTDGHDALYFAINLHKLDLINRLLAAGADAKSSQAVGLAGGLGDLPIVRRLLDAGADGKKISIYVCIRSGYVEIARLALEHGADPDPHDNAEKRYNVYWALYYKQPEILKMILDRGADPTVETIYPDEAPLKYAQKWYPAMVPVIQEAVDKWKHRGASTTQVDRFGRSTVTVTVTPVPPPGIKWVKMAIQTEGRAMDATTTPDGRSLQMQMIAGGTMMRTVCRAESGRLYFSECRRFQITDAQVKSGKALTADFATNLPGLDLKGRLDSSVPRPVKNGLAVVCVSSGLPSPQIHGWLLWSRSAEVHPDGTFEISNLPPPTSAIPTDDGAGPLQLIVSCDGYVSKDPDASTFEYAAGSQTFVPPIADPLTVSMEPTGSARVRVLDPNGKPLPGALVQFSPDETFRSEQQFLWYSTQLRSAQNDEAQIFHEEASTQFKAGELLPYQRLLAKYQAVTNQDGVAEISDLPPGLEPYTVEKTRSDMPYRLRIAGSWSKYAQNGIVTVAPGTQAIAEMKLIPKIAPIRIAHSTSPNGKYVISVEPSRDNSVGTGGPQDIVVRDATTGKVEGATVPPPNAQHEVDLIKPTDRLEVTWNRSSTGFYFCVWHTDHFDVLGVILIRQQNQLGLGVSDLSEGMGGKIVSCELAGAGTLHVRVLQDSGKTDDFYYSITADGRFQGSSQSPAGKT